MRRTACLLALLAACLLLVTACSTAKTNREEQFSSAFTAKIEGTRQGLAFTAELTVTETEQTVRYTAPQTLAGLTITKSDAGCLLSNAKTEIAIDETGLLEPLKLLVSSSPLAAVREQNGEKTLTYADGGKILLQKDGTPKAVTGETLFYTVTEFTPLP